MSLDPKDKARTEWNSENIITFDIEAYDWTNPVALGMYDGEGYKEFTDNPVKDFVQEVMQRKYRNCRFVAHNGGNYDFIPIISHLLEYAKEYSDLEMDMEILEKGSNSIFYIKVTMGDTEPFYFQDSMALMPRGLDTLANAFLDKSKDDFDVSKIGPKEEMSTEMWGTMLEYLQKDCVLLYDILTEFTEMIEDFSGGNIGPQLTIGSTSMEMYRVNYQNESIAGPIDNEEKARKAYYGGRTEVFKHRGSDLNYYDVNSLYPYVYSQKPIPTGPAMYCKNPPLQEGEGGVIKATVEIDREGCYDIPPLPHRYQADDWDAERVLFPSGEFTGWFPLCELRYAKEIGALAQVDTIEGWVAKTSKPFKQFGEELYEEKLTADSTAKYNLTKLLMNGFYGKFGMEREQSRIFKDNSQEARDKYYNDEYQHLDPDLAMIHRIYKETEKSGANYIIPRIAISITGWARVEMHKWLMRAKEKGGDIWYCDTDSIVTDVSLPESEELGGLDLEHQFQEGIFLSPKVYAGMEDNNPIIKAKGMKTNNISWNDFKQAYEDNSPNNISSSFVTVRSFRASVKDGIENLFESREMDRELKSFDVKRNHDIENNTSESIKL